MRFKLPNHEKNGKPLLVLFDGMALAYRAYFAFISRPLVDSKGNNTSAVYGFMTAMLQFLEHHDPTHAAVCFDTAAPTFRHLRYDAYKANRQKMPEDLPPQLDKIKELVRAFHIPQLELSGFEADDIIGTLAKFAERNEVDTLIVTPDKDFCQLVTPHIKLLRPAKEGREMEIFDEAAVREKYGLEPNQIIDYLALVGDASDNIPGVRGIGEKTAAPLLQQFGSLDGIYAHIDKVEKKALKEKLLLDRENGLLSYELATIDTNVDLPFTLETLRYGLEPDFDSLLVILEDLGFKSLTARVKKDREALAGSPPGAQPVLEEIPNEPKSEEEQALEAFDFQYDTPDEEQTIKTSPHAYVMVNTLDGLRELVSSLGNIKEFAFDLETTGKDANSAEIIGMSFAWQPGEAFYVPILLERRGAPQTGGLFDEQPAQASQETRDNAYYVGLPPSKAIALVKPILENRSIGKIGQNLKYDALLMRHYGVYVAPTAFDTMVGSYILRSEGSHSMDSLSAEYLKYKPVSLSEVAGQLRDATSRESMAVVPTHKLAEYGAEDADVTLKLKLVIDPLLREEKLLDLCTDVEFPIVEVLTTMEFNGVKIDGERLAAASKEMESEARNICATVYEYAGGPFNLDSTKQLADILFGKLGLKSGKKTKSGYSTDAGVLEELKGQHPIAEEILKYRQYQKLRSTYVDALPQLINPKTGMVHTSYNQAVVATGRISSTDPNLQNIPVRTDMGRDIRRAFVSRFKDGYILSSDYSQIELRIIAHVTSDPALLEAFANNEDIHTRTAAQVFGVALDEVTRDMRRKAKEVNYGIMYGIGAFGLARRLGIPQKEGGEIIQRYFAAFPTIKQYMDDTLDFARRTGYVQTLLGRRRYMRNINASNHAVRAADERAAINMPIQGTAAEMMKIAMVNIHQEMRERKIQSLMIMQVHDELVFDVVPDETEEMKELVPRLMSSAMPMQVKIDVDAGIGRTWFDAH